MKLNTLVVGLLLATGVAIADDNLLDTSSETLTPQQVRARMMAASVAPPAQPAAHRPVTAGIPPRQVMNQPPAVPGAVPLPGGRMPMRPDGLSRMQMRGGPGMPVPVPGPAQLGEAPDSDLSAAAGGVRVESVTREVKQRQKSTSKTLPGLASGKPIKPLVIEVKPGVTEVIKIARSFPSLIMTPFADPQVVDGGKVRLVYSGSNVYVMPVGSEPEALFISDKAKPGVVVSLMVMPEDLPAQQVTIQLDGYKGPSQEIGEQREKKDDYVSELIDIMREVGQGSAPFGYTESSVADIEAQMGPLVAVPDRKYTGTDRDIFRYQLTNTGGSSITVSEPSFYTKGVRAVALFPRIHLEPKETTTLYIMTDKAKKEGNR